MAALRRPKYLTCFYCGRRTSTRYDGRVRQFECPNCDATNYLDENGEITDPPVATSTPTSKPLQYAVPRVVSPRSSTPSQDIFCETCLKNQHLFTASLAQYFPEDVDHPEYAELEKNYYKFRRGLEQRYPQVCANCEAKVLERIQAAGYTAKTDHLRRMIDRSRKARNVTAWSQLDLIDAAGKWSWIVGFVLQLLWHASAMFTLFRRHAHLGDHPESSCYMDTVALLFKNMPPPEALIHWSVVVSISSSWWNPRFVQTVRGFTKHVIGLPKWYTYQIMLITLKIAAMKVSALPTSQDSSVMMQVGAHAFMVVFISFIYNTARRSIRTDTTPLFGVRSPTTSPQVQQPRETRAVTKQSMSDILDDILDEPSSTAGIAVPGLSPTSVAPQALDYNRIVQPRSSYNPSTAAIAGNPFRQAVLSSDNEVSLGSLTLDSAAPTTQLVHYEEEMDWSPTQSRHRAFNSLGTSQGQTHRFGETPTEPMKGQFWYKVPPAPTNPAQRIFNPPNAPRIRTSPAAPAQLQFRGSQDKLLGGLNRADETKTVDFANPSFFPEPQQADPRNTLSDLFGQGFSLSPSQKEGGQQRQQGGTISNSSLRSKTSRAPLRIAETMVLVVCLAVWYHATSSQHHYVAQVSIGVLAVCVAIMVSINGDTLKDLGAGKELTWASAVATIMGISEIYLATMFALQLWTSGSDCGTCDSQPGWLIGTMVVHQLWDLFFVVIKDASVAQEL